MKTLANCKPSEFLKQTVKIRHSVEKWLDLTDIINIRKKSPDIKPGMSPEEIREVKLGQAKQNLSRMLDAALEEHPDETLELLALICFMEPSEVDNHTMDYYMDAISEVLSNRSVLNFFYSLVQLGQTNTSGVSKA